MSCDRSDEFRQSGMTLITDPVPAGQGTFDFESREDMLKTYRATIDVTVRAGSFGQAIRALHDAVEDMNDRNAVTATLARGPDA